MRLCASIIARTGGAQAEIESTITSLMSAGRMLAL